jgi:hypothetical protein
MLVPGLWILVEDTAFLCGDLRGMPFFSIMQHFIDTLKH